MHTYKTKRKLQFFHSFIFYRETEKIRQRKGAWRTEQAKKKRDIPPSVCQIPLIENVRMVHGVCLEPLQPSVHCMAENAFLIFLFAFFLSFLILLFTLFTVELIPWMFCHDNILNIVYRITMCYANWNILERETTHCFSHNAQTHTCTNTLNGSFVGSLIL